MTYSVYFRDYSKAEVKQSILQQSPFLYGFLASFVATLIISGFLLIPNAIESTLDHEQIAAIQPEITFQIIDQEPVAQNADLLEQRHPGSSGNNTVSISEDLHDNHEYLVEDISDPDISETEILNANESIVANKEDLLSALTIQKKKQAALLNEEVHQVTIKSGDSLALIFNRLSLNSSVLHEVISLGKETSVLKSIIPGQMINFHIKDKQLISLEYEYALTKSLQVKRESGKFVANIIESEIEKRVRYANAEINSSLFLAGQNAGITDKVIMNLVGIYGWDIDFALDIRSGDKFAILFEEHFKDGKKINNGPILAAEFINQGHVYRAVRYHHENGDVNYYSDTGHNMRKAFIRTPVNFSRISSRFNLKRKHPVLNTIRAHKGVDYAAATGTPIKATGDGVVTLKGVKGGYGRTVTIQHGGTYTTLYAHMSKYAKDIKRGSRVKQGQIIGYVGKSGLATGPHLHYEFRVNGVHRNPLKVKIPKALRIPEEIMADFTAQTQPILAQLDQYISQSEAIAKLPISSTDETTVLAMGKTDAPIRVTQ